MRTTHNHKNTRNRILEQTKSGFRNRISHTFGTLEEYRNSWLQIVEHYRKDRVKSSHFSFFQLFGKSRKLAE